MSRIDFAERDCNLGRERFSSLSFFTLELLLMKLILRMTPSPLSLRAASSCALSLPESYDPNPRLVSPRVIPADAGYTAAECLVKDDVAALFRLDTTEEPAME